MPLVLLHLKGDVYGNNDGYARPIEIMLGQIEAAQAGSQEVFFGKELTGIFSANNNPAAGAKAPAPTPAAYSFF